MVTLSTKQFKKTSLTQKLRKKINQVHKPNQVTWILSHAKNLRYLSGDKIKCFNIANRKKKNYALTIFQNNRLLS